MYCTYILYAIKCDRYYIGHCENIEARLKRHNDGFVAATRNCRPYELKACKYFENRDKARKEELRIKRQKSRKYLEWLIVGNW